MRRRVHDDLQCDRGLGVLASGVARGLLIAAAVCVSVGAARAESPTTSKDVTDLARLVPKDALTVYWGRYDAAMAVANETVVRMLRWVELARQLKLIPKPYRTISDIAGTLPLLGKYDHAVALLDVSSRSLPGGGSRLAMLEVAIILHTEGDNEPVVNRIRRLLSNYTDKQFGKINVIDHDGTKSYRLADARLPGWATWHWGPVGDCYVIGIGPKAFEKVFAAWRDADKSILADAWFTQARQRCQGPRAMIEWLVNYEAIRKRLEPVVKGRPENVMRALAGGDIQRGFATLRMDDRYLIVRMVNRFEGKDFFRVLSDPSNLPTERLSDVPADASCAIVKLDLAEWIGRVRDAYLASMIPSQATMWQGAFADLEERNNIRFKTHFFDRLGDHLIVHTWPRHPLDLPMTFTLMFEIDDEVMVQDAVDVVMGAWQDLQRRATTRRATTASTNEDGGGDSEDWFRFPIGREPDGMWYIQAGLVRPAVAVAHGYLIVSWSPEAVRENIRWLAEHPRRPTTIPTQTPK